MHNWPQQLLAQRDGDTPVVLVTVAGIRGSAPREIGSKMIVTERGVQGTIGGGYLENECIRLACSALRDGNATPARKLRRFALGSQCGQCCGGVVDVLFEQVSTDAEWVNELAGLQQRGERVALVSLLQTGADAHKWIVRESDPTSGNPAPDDNLVARAVEMLREGHVAGTLKTRAHDHANVNALIEPVGPAPLSIVLFGAGHVGKACAQVLGTLDAEVLVVDSRPEYIEHDWPENVTAVFADDPALLVAHCRANSHYLIMTHDHAIDLTLCLAVLGRDDRAFCGLIGSRSKQRRFEKKLRAAGISEQQLTTLTCPIGIDTIGGKHPGEIAIAAAAQIVSLHQQRLAGTHSEPHVVTALPPTLHNDSSGMTLKPQAR